MNCFNCGHELNQAFCGNCGQLNADFIVLVEVPEVENDTQKDEI